jgi:uncharacterized protein YjiS (DUF1127 family)
MASFANTSRNRPGQADAADFLGFAMLFRGLHLLTQSVADQRAERRERRQMARELSTYTDRELNELGFSPADLPMIAAGTYRP